MPRTKKNAKQNRRGVPSGALETPDTAGGFKNPPQQKESLPAQAFAIVPDPADPSDWQLPHHTRHVLKDAEGSVDWLLIKTATQLLSLQGDEGRRVSADPALIIDAARHIAGHYRAAGKPIPTALCVLI